jgi:hypothetical protein
VGSALGHKAAELIDNASDGRVAPAGALAHEAVGLEAEVNSGVEQTLCGVQCVSSLPWRPCWCCHYRIRHRLKDVGQRLSRARAVLRTAPAYEGTACLHMR